MTPAVAPDQPPCWYQEVRYAQGPGASQTLQETSELRYKEALDAARVFNQMLAAKPNQPIS